MHSASRKGKKQYITITHWSITQCYIMQSLFWWIYIELVQINGYIEHYDICLV